MHAVCNQTTKPNVIVIVDSSGERGMCPKNIISICDDSGIRLVYKHEESAMPGEARNIGVRISNSEIIAFIDVQTIPRPHWLDTSLKLLAKDSVSGVWGSTCFSAETNFEKLVRDGFFGTLPLKTLPGSVFKSEVLPKAGQFIDWVRAGEDTEWMLRVDVLKIPIIQPSNALVDYVGLIDSGLKQLLMKWNRNYSASRNLPHLFPQKLLLWLVFYPLLILSAFNWNYLVADWRMDSPLYIYHVTKIVAVLPFIIYIIIRGLILPLQRGISFKRLLPTRFLIIAAICFMADLVKVRVFSLLTQKQDDPEPKT